MKQDIGHLMKLSDVTFFTKSKETTAIEHLRVLAPLQSQGIKVNRYVFEKSLDLNTIEPSHLIVIQRDFARDFQNYQRLLNYSKQKHIPIILDLDDNLLDLPPTHPDRLSHYYSDSLLPLLQAMTDVDAITVTTNPLKENVISYNQNVYLLPNFLDDKLWHFKAPKVETDESSIKLLYMGTHTHSPDLEMISSAIDQLLKEFPTLHFTSYGVKLPKLLEGNERVSYVMTDSMEYAEFATLFQKMDADIAIAPLVQNKFNEQKSPLKFFEYCVNGIPGIYSNVNPYKNFVKHGKTGLLAENTTLSWVENIKRLILDKSFRKDLAIQAQENVKADYLLSKNSYLWRDVYNKILANEKSTKSALTLSTKTLQNINTQMSENAENRRSRLNSLEHQNADLEQKVTNQSVETEKIVVGYEAAIQEMNQEREKVVSELTAEIQKTRDGYEAVIQNLNKEREEVVLEIIVETEKIINGYEAAIQRMSQEHERVVHNLRADFSKLDIEHEKTLEELEETKSCLENSEQTLEEIFTSNSWKLTRPIRKVKGIVNKIKKQEDPHASDKNLVLRSGLFDEKWYKRNNPDVALSNIRPIDHYFLYCVEKGLNPSEKFDTLFYLESYPDVASSGINPLVHYLKHGKNENRLPKAPKDS